jgi:hypothetical protein
MNRILQVNTEDLEATAGFTHEQLNDHLRDSALFVDPGAIGTLGGIGTDLTEIDSHLD